MSIKRVSIAEAVGHLAELMEAAKHGDEVVIEDNEHAQVKLVPIERAHKKKRTFGQFKGMIWMSPDFDEPLPESFLLSGQP